MRLTRPSTALVFIAISAISTSASAHLGLESHGHGSFVSGFTHPLLGLDHLLAMLGVGLWSALTARHADARLLWGPASFATLLLAGALAGVQGVVLPGLEPMIALSLLALGLLVATRLHTPGAVAALVVGTFAVFHGLAHGQELAGSATVWQALAGMLLATIVLHAAGLATGWALRTRPRWMARTMGAGVAAVGGGLLLQLA
jgi:urease accessory protein